MTTPYRQLQLRRGLAIDLPTLEDGELGWAEDTQELFIGNGGLNVQIYPPGGTATLTWTKYTVTFADLAAATLANDASLLNLPVRGLIHGVVIKHNTAFQGGGILSYTLSVGVAIELDRYASAFDVFQAPSNTAFQNSVVAALENFGAVTNIRVAAVSTGANLDQATQGTADIYVLTSSLP